MADRINGKPSQSYFAPKWSRLEASLIAGSIAGGMEHVSKGPFETIRILQQKRNPISSSALISTLKSRGVSGLMTATSFTGATAILAHGP